MVTTRLEGAIGALEIGEKKEAEGDLCRAHMAYETAINDFMHLALVECDSADAVKTWVANQPLQIALDGFVRISNFVIAEPRSEWTRYFQSGNYLLIAFSHFCSALGQHERARFLSQIATEPVLFSTAFWAEYSKVYDALSTGRYYSPKFGKFAFLDKYVSCYVDLMLAVMQGEPLGSPLAEIDRQFILRNADRRMNDADAYMIEGSAEYPVKFDFRKAGLLATIAHTKTGAII
ncbi:hypothetical protein [Sphingosinicella sp. BN140058]|uniref:hypothetical protein n=1 Tax=Sphingosinicella sp. BN140058 TaxID=1892855 RepID=UPI001011C2D8|nr:hypothetical protein [Sphingosinicella sp. BN140058]QAY78910.1 hypothetical protein ETR14_22000 [Sphingosinicella sp. BN140058]